jgi:phenylacetate-CoA ligase
VYRGSRERAVQIAKWLRVLFANGYSTRDKVMALVPPARAREGRSVLQHFGFLRRRAVDYLESSPEEMVDLLFSYRPQVLYGNRAHLDLMALEIRRRGLPTPGLKLLIVGAEVVHDSSRRLYRDAFGIEPLEYYGSVEMGVMAYETPARDGLRLCEDLNCFEFLDDDGNPVASGEPGRVVVTDLTARVMPFIRYDQGDLAVFQEGATGDAGGRRLRRILGRDEDYVVLPDGARRSFHVFYNALHDFPDVLQFRVVQETADRFRILLVTPPDRYAAVRDGLLVRLRQAFPPGVTFDVTRVERIEPDATGKIRRVVSKVAR